jgi:hypothetical protein
MFFTILNNILSFIADKLYVNFCNLHSKVMSSCCLIGVYVMVDQ